MPADISHSDNIKFILKATFIASGVIAVVIFTIFTAIFFLFMV